MTQEIVQKYLKALSERNLEEIMQLFSDKVDWLVPGNQSLAPWVGQRQTRDEIKTFFQLLWQNTEPISANISAIMIEGFQAMITGNFASRMLATNAVFESLFFISLTIENNRIVSYRLLEDTYGLVKALSR